jgi:ABC-type cobalamin transport system ATPase subunit
MVIHGEVGVGKSALLNHMAGLASGSTVVRAGGLVAQRDQPNSAA